ncbi:MAG: flavin reductase family protein [Thermoplasmata archaeon HGW-Thermoplasmata-1]|nr:MAG: flavin reductase family protein [Thermoplasmata archaeon HGW-Thermoplasmata-1]
MKKPAKLSQARNFFPNFPVALVSVGDNIISIGLVHIFSFEPHIIGIGVRRERHSYGLIKELGEFAVNIPTSDMVDAVNGCGRTSGRDTDKFEKFGLTRMDAKEIKSKLVAECPVNIECRVVKEVEFDDEGARGTHPWFFGEVVAVHAEEGYDTERALLYWNGKYRREGEIVGKRE